MGIYLFHQTSCHVKFQLNDVHGTSSHNKVYNISTAAAALRKAFTSNNNNFPINPSANNK